jgi:hypothetical protein
MQHGANSIRRERLHAHRPIASGVCDVPVRGHERLSTARLEYREKIRRARHRRPADADSQAELRKPVVTDSGLVHLVAPACWKSADRSGRRRADQAVRVSAPAKWRRARPVSSQLAASTPVAEAWLLPPAWPLDGWRVTPADARHVIDARIMPWVRTRMRSRQALARPWKYMLAAAAAMSAVAAIVLVSLRIGMPQAVVPLASDRVLKVVPAKAIPVVHPLSLLIASPPAPAVAALTPRSVSTASSTARSVPVETDGHLLADVSTMDLMMPIAEPDLDIASRQSLWSQIGKASGVDPLLLYSVALVESKALYPDGKIAPTPWLFRVNDHLVRGNRHDVQLAMAAASQFGSAVQDVGIMQVYYPMHRDAVRDPLTLLNPRTNITVAAKILRDGMHETHDRVLGVGYYHSHTPALARDYGTAVLTVYQRLKAMHRLPSNG